MRKYTTRELAYTEDNPRTQDPVENRPLVPYTPSATGGALPRSPVSVVMLPTGGGHMASGEGDGVRVRVRVGEGRRVRDEEGVRVRDGERVLVWNTVEVRVLAGVPGGVPLGVGMESDAGRHGSATPEDENDAGTAV